MLNLLKKQLKNEKGLTLIELLVVVVILGIIAAIAVVSVGGIMDNSKKDAHVANAQQMVNAAKMWVTANGNDQDFFSATDDTEDLTLDGMYDEKLLDSMIDPDTKDAYPDLTGSKVTITKNDDDSFSYTVTLLGAEKTIDEVPATELKRASAEDK